GNYAGVVEQPARTPVLANPAVWVAVVVGIPVVVSLALAQLLNEPFPGRALVRWALIVPWAASLIITSKLFVWIYDYYFGALNQLLVSVGLLTRPVDWLRGGATRVSAQSPGGGFVSLPFPP